jgi:acetyl esterase/lipase
MLVEHAGMGNVRLYQSLDAAGVPVKLDIYEGMPHNFARPVAAHNVTPSSLFF